MKHRGLFAAAFVSLALMGCAGLNNAVTSITTTPQNQENQVAIVENSYTLLGRATLLYLNSGRADPAIATEIARLDNIAYDALVAARRAVANGNNALVAAALDVFTRRTADLKSYLTSKGIPVQ